MNQEYVDTVRLLLAIAPAVFQSPRFALKGGTALNLFLHDMPRLSVDIDVVFTDHALGREDALRAIAADLKAAKTAISGQAAAFGFEKGPTGRQLKRRMINMVHLKGRNAIVTGSNVCSFVWFADLMS